MGRWRSSPGSWHNRRPVGQDRLTRQELSWLLAQEARSAASALRSGLSQHPPAPDVTIQDLGGANVEVTLDALDASIGMLTALQQSGSTRTRRGRIDLAALLCEVAPSARISMETGAGTEVAGDEAELRRMLSVLVSQTAAPLGEFGTAEMKIRREGEWIRVEVELGPDTSSTAAMERRWLSRMAIRQGGRVELDGATQTLILPAAGGDQSEVEQLRKELEQAQQLGEAYARELAAAFSAGDLPSPSSLPPAPDEGLARFEAMVRYAASVLRPLRNSLEQLRTDTTRVSQALGDRADLALALSQQVSASFELLGEVGRVGSADVTAEPAVLDLGAAARRAASDVEARAARHGVSLSVDADDGVSVKLREGPLALMLRSLLDHAIAASPKSATVNVLITKAGSSALVTVEDAGPVVPAARRNDVLQHRIDPTQVGRPDGPALLVAATVASYLGSTLLMKETPDGTCSVEVDFPLSG